MKLQAWLRQPLGGLRRMSRDGVQSIAGYEKCDSLRRGIKFRLKNILYGVILVPAGLLL
jgi:hypothetical protein